MKGRAGFQVHPGFAVKGEQQGSAKLKTEDIVARQFSVLTCAGYVIASHGVTCHDKSMVKS